MKIRKTLILLLVVLCVSALFLGGYIRGHYNRLFCVPELLKNRSFVRLDTCVSPDDARKDFFAVYQSRVGFSGLSQMLTSIEGDNILLHLATSEGIITLISDHTRDRYSRRNFVSEPVSEISLGFLDPNGTFVPLHNQERPSICIRIICTTKAGQVLYYF